MPEKRVSKTQVDAEAEALKVMVEVPEPFCRFYKATLKLEASGETLEEWLQQFFNNYLCDFTADLIDTSFNNMFWDHEEIIEKYGLQPFFKRRNEKHQAASEK